MTFIPSFVDLFWAFNFIVDLVYIFLGFPLNADFAWPFLGLSAQVIWFESTPRLTDLNQLTSQAVSRRLESIQLVTEAAFQELTQNQLMTQVDSQVLIQIDSWLKMFPDFLFKLTHATKEKLSDSESTHASTLSHTHVCWTYLWFLFGRLDRGLWSERWCFSLIWTLGGKISYFYSFQLLLSIT